MGGAATVRVGVGMGVGEGVGLGLGVGVGVGAANDCNATHVGTAECGSDLVVGSPEDVVGAAGAGTARRKGVGAGSVGVTEGCGGSVYDIGGKISCSHL